MCDGRVDDSRAIASAIAAARAAGTAVLVPPGVCAYGDVIRLDGVKLVGTGEASVLYALDWSRESIFIYGDGAEVRNLRLAGVTAPSRQAAWEATRISLFGARQFVIDNVTIDGSAAAGIQTASASGPGRITNNRLRRTLSDAIHLTDRAHDIEVSGNHIDSAGDDGIAVVSYREDGGLVSRITARHNVVLNNRWGRLMSVVGGSEILYEHNVLENNLASFACVYIAQEAGYATFAASRVTVQRNTLRNCGGHATGHGAVMVYSDGQAANAGISLVRNDVQQQGQPGIRIFGPNTDVTLDSNRITGADPALDITTPGVRVVSYTTGPVGAAP